MPVSPRLLLFTLTIGLLPLLLAADPPPARPAPLSHLPAPRGYVCLRATKPPVIDGKLDDAAWANAPWSEDFVDIEGDKKPKPTYRTRMKMLWDETGLSIAAEISEPHVWATLTEHDSVIFHDPDFELFIDPNGDNLAYAEMELNAKNTTWDLLLTKPYRDGGQALNGWEMVGLKTAVHVDGTLNNPADTDTGWTVEIHLPWRAVADLGSGASMPPKDADRWRINFSRVEWDVDVKDGRYEKVPKRAEHNWVWSPQGVIDMHRPERWGYLQFSTQSSGPVAYNPEPAQAVKDAVCEVHDAQLEYFGVRRRFARTLDELKLTGSPVEFTATPHGYEASLKAGKAAGGKRWIVTQDGKLWSE